MEKENDKPAKMTFDGIEYDYETLSDNAKGQIMGIQYADAEIKQMKMQSALTQTARNSYIQALQLDQTEAINKDDAAFLQVSNCDAEIRRLNMQTAIAETARNSYLYALQSDLPKTEKNDDD